MQHTGDGTVVKRGDWSLESWGCFPEEVAVVLTQRAAPQLPRQPLRPEPGCRRSQGVAGAGPPRGRRADSAEGVDGRQRRTATCGRPRGSACPPDTPLLPSPPSLGLSPAHAPPFTGSPGSQPEAREERARGRERPAWPGGWARARGLEKGSSFRGSLSGWPQLFQDQSGSTFTPQRPLPFNSNQIPSRWNSRWRGDAGCDVEACGLRRSQP